jgi:hypothetical protein
MTRRSLLALFTIGPFARRLPLPAEPPLPRVVVDECHEHHTRELFDTIGVTCFGDANQVYLPRIRTPR